MKIKNAILASLIVVLFVATTFSAVNASHGIPPEITHRAYDKGVWDFNVINLLDHSITVNIDGIDHVIPPARIGSNGFPDSEDCTIIENGFTRDSVLTYDGVKIPALITDETYQYLNCVWKPTFDECRDIPEARIVAHTLKVESNGKFFILGLF
jgi:hypothetical protein